MRRFGLPWMPYEDAFLRENAGMRARELAVILERPVDGVKARRRMVMRTNRSFEQNASDNQRMRAWYEQAGMHYPVPVEMDAEVKP